MIAVFAGSYEQYCQLLRDFHLDEKDAPWVYRREDIVGREFHNIVQCGTWWKLHNHELLITLIRLQILERSAQKTGT